MGYNYLPFYFLFKLTEKVQSPINKFIEDIFR